MHRFYCPGSIEGPQVVLPEDEAHHLTRVLRLKPGESVEIFDGQGNAATARIIEAGRRQVSLRVEAQHRSFVRPRPAIRLLVAAPKADRLRWLIEKAAELGVARVSLLQTEHSVVHPGAGKVDKLRATVIAACKQCNRNDLMTVDAPRPWPELVDEVTSSGNPFYIATLDTPGIAQQLDVIRGVTDVAIAVGPEGDWDTAEIALATGRGAIPVGLGPLTLRVETAAIAVVSTILLAAGDTQ